MARCEAAQNHRGIDPALEAIARIARQIQSPRRAANARRQEVSGFEQNIFRRVGDAGFFATHHAANADRALLVRDDQILRRERVGLAVEREKLFAFAREAHVDFALQFVRIERVRRLPELEHHEIRDVDDVVDRAQPDGLQFRAQPVRARTDCDVFDPARGIKRAFVRRGDLNACSFAGSGALACRRLVGNRSGCPASAAISRARPKWLSKSPRFGVISTSRIVSAGKSEPIGAPIFASGERIKQPVAVLRKGRARSGCTACLAIRRRAVCSA